MPTTQGFHEGARIFELLAMLSVESMPNEVDLNAIGSIAHELAEILGDRDVFPMDIDLEYGGKALHFEGRLEWLR